MLGTLSFFCFVLSYNRAVPNYFHNRVVPNHFHNRAVPNHFHTPNYFHIKFLIYILAPLTKYATLISHANQMFVMVRAKMNSCVLLTLNIFL